MKSPRNILHERRRRAAGVKIAGVGLTKLNFCSRVLYLVGNGKQKIPKVSSLSKSQKCFTPTGIEAGKYFNQESGIAVPKRQF